LPDSDYNYKNSSRIQKRIAFVYYNFSSFVKQDFEILSRHFKVIRVNFSGYVSIPEMAIAIARSDITFSWFAGGHAFLAVLLSKVFKKKSVVVIGGFDVAYCPEINYGQYTQSWFKKMFTTFVLNEADLLLPVSDFTNKEILQHSRPKRAKIIFNGVDVHNFIPHSEKENIVLTVASGCNVIKLKGIDTFIKAAGFFPQVWFKIVGLCEIDITHLKYSGIPNNVELLGYVSRNNLIEFYQRSKVYCQLSYRESFGLAVAEAMSCGCTPVVAKKAALPEVVGDTGYFVPYGDVNESVKAIELALGSNINSAARKRIETLFPVERREKRLIETLSELG